MNCSVGQSMPFNYHYSFSSITEASISDLFKSRQMRQASLRTVQDLVTPERKFIISGYDEFLGEVQVL